MNYSTPHERVLGFFFQRPISRLVVAWGLLSTSVAVVLSQPYSFTTVAGRPGLESADGTNTEALFSYPWGVAVDGATNIYIADNFNKTIRRISPVGTNWVASTLAGLTRQAGFADGTNSDARFWQPYGLAVDSGGNLYVAD